MLPTAFIVEIDMYTTLIINGVVYMVDDVNMLPSLVGRAAALSPHKRLRNKTGDEMTDGMIENRKAPNPQAPLRILFVEDNDYVRELTLSLLEDSHREVVAFGSAEDALAAFERQPFDVVITDVSLPGMSGIEFAKRLLKIAPDTWCIIASGYQLPTNLEQLGAHVRSMTKPFDSEQVDAILAEVRSARAFARADS